VGIFNLIFLFKLREKRKQNEQNASENNLSANQIQNEKILVYENNNK
jgi:hypothetical protein